MAGFRDQFITGSKYFSNLLSTRRLVQLSGQKLILPFYHSVSDKALPHIQHLYLGKNKESFSKDLDFLLKEFSPIGLDDLFEVARGNRQLSKPSFLLSFDDGLSEFHSIIAPILLQKGIPAVCFLNSKFVDNKDLFFRYKASLLIDAFVNNPMLIKQSEFANFTFLEIKTKILAVKYDNKDKLDTWAENIQLDFDDFLANQKPYLTSDQIKTLIEQGFYFGAHSKDHPEYQYLSLEEQLRQTKESVEFVQNKFNLSQKTFSFPFTDYGVSKQFFNQIASENIAELTFGCAGQKIENTSTHFQRLPFEMDQLSAKQIINGELLYFLMKQPLGKNRIQRK